MTCMFTVFVYKNLYVKHMYVYVCKCQHVCTCQHIYAYKYVYMCIYMYMGGLHCWAKDLRIHTIRKYVHIYTYIYLNISMPMGCIYAHLYVWVVFGVKEMIRTITQLLSVCVCEWIDMNKYIQIYMYLYIHKSIYVHIHTRLSTHQRYIHVIQS